MKERIKRFYIQINYLFKNHKVNNKASSPNEDRGTIITNKFQNQL